MLRGGEHAFSAHECTSSAEAAVLACGLRGMLSDDVRVGVKVGTHEEVHVGRDSPPEALEVRLRQRPPSPPAPLGEV